MVEIGGTMIVIIDNQSQFKLIQRSERESEKTQKGHTCYALKSLYIVKDLKYEVVEMMIESEKETQEFKIEETKLDMKEDKIGCR